MISIIIPAYREPFLQNTIDSLLENAYGEVEILAVLDGWEPEKPIRPDKRVIIIKLKKNLGMRTAINAGIMAAKGKFIMKCDAHCAFAVNFDRVLTENCAEDWLVIPRRYSLDENNWQRDFRRERRDYHYLTFPEEFGHYGVNIRIVDWFERTRERKDPKYDIDDTMTFQGSCWFAHKKFFLKRVGFLNDSSEAYGPFADEPQEIGLKYWLSGAKVKLIKKTWYAHLSKRRHHYAQRLFSRVYKINSAAARSRTWSAKHWVNNEEPGAIHSFSWLVEKFWPVPTWPEDRSFWKFNGFLVQKLLKAKGS